MHSSAYGNTRWFIIIIFIIVMRRGGASLSRFALLGVLCVASRYTYILFPVCRLMSKSSANRLARISAKREDRECVSVCVFFFLACVFTSISPP